MPYERAAHGLCERRRQRKIRRQEEAAQTLRFVADRLAAWDRVMADERAQRSAARRPSSRRPVAT